MSTADALKLTFIVLGVIIGGALALGGFVFTVVQASVWAATVFGVVGFSAVIVLAVLFVVGLVVFAAAKADIL